MKKLIAFLTICVFCELFSIPELKNENDVLQYVKTFLPTNPIILEAGGNLGEDTLRMKSFWPNATMHVFEPLPLSFKKMKEATEHLSNINYYPYALSDHTGTTNFYINIPNNGASSIGRPLAFNQDEFDPTSINVKCLTINAWVKLYNINHIDFMWLDMESHELYALKNSLNVLNTVRAIYTEVAYTPVRGNSCLYPDLKKFLEDNNFSEVWKMNCGRFGNALFIKKDLLQ